MDISQCVPLIAPADYFESGAFPAPHQPLYHPDLALTWVLLTEGQTMTYLPKPLAGEWQAQGLDWATHSLENLRRLDGAITHEKRNANGDLVFVAMMHEDGLGSSRVLLHAELVEVFPEGYRLGIPDRSMAIAFPAGLNGRDLEEVKALIERCYRDATTPMLGTILSPKDLSPR